MINVYVISGFLGAGKTTFIQKLLSEKTFSKVMLLENEFGKVGVDSSFFDSNLNVKEINNGCICCSLKGDFHKALHEIEEMNVTDLIVEPSGVGKLSEIINTIKEDDDFQIVSHICIVDVKTCKKYHNNFKDYFNDQVINANSIVFSHVDVADEKTINDAKAIVKELNPNASILEKPVKDMPIGELLDFIVKDGKIEATLEKMEEEEHECCHHHHHHDEDEEGECCCHHHHHDDDDDDDDEHEHHHHHHDDDDEDEHEHHHHHHHDDDDDDDDEDEDFKSCAIKTDYVFTEEEVKNILKGLDESVIRCKGYLNTDKGTLYVNYILNEDNSYIGAKKDNGLIVIIAPTVDKAHFKELFHAQ